MITLHHANTRGSRAARLRIAHLCVPKTIVIHVSCLIYCRTWRWLRAHVFPHPSHLPLPSFRQSHHHKQDLWFSTCIYPAMFHGRVADQHKSHLSQVMSPNRLRSKSSRPKRSSLHTSSPEELSLTGILGQIRINIRKDLEKFHFWRYGWIWKSWCRDFSPPVTDSFRLWLSGEHCRLGSWRWRTAKMLASPLYMQSREDCESSRMPIAPRKLAAMFSSRNEEPGNQFKSSFFKNADPLNLGRSLIEGNKDHFLSQARSELMRQEHQVGALINCISELQQ